jgi:hypothetical protein
MRSRLVGISVSALAATAFALAGCATVQITAENRDRCGPRPTDAEAAQAVSIYTSNFLKDPFSAQVRNISILEPAGWQVRGALYSGEHNAYGWKIYFEVNAKNSYGGYVGWEPKRLLRTPEGRVYAGTVQGPE